MAEVIWKQFPCPLCGGALETGFVMDRMGSAQKPAEWIGGEPVSSFWRGTDASAAPHRKLEAFRCQGCGHVMLFARQMA